MHLLGTLRDIPKEILDKWQVVVDTLARIVGVPTGLIMRVDPPEIEVLVSSRTRDNPFYQGERVLTVGHYCEKVIREKAPLLVPIALRDPEWHDNPDLKKDMVSYLGFPLMLPDGKVFGTICVLDDKENAYSKLYKDLMAFFKQVIETDLKEALGWEETLRFTKFFVDHSADGVFWLRPDCSLIYVNDTACRLFEFSRENLLTMKAWEVAPDLNEEVWPDFWCQLKENSSLISESRFMTRTGRVFPVDITWNCLSYGEQDYGCAFVRDISGRKAAEKKLKKAFSEIKKLKERIEAENIFLREEISIKCYDERIIGQSEAIQRVLSQGMQVADTDTTVLLLGESGTGKELVAQAIHNNSPRRHRHMVTVNCATLPANLVESELFGRERGAYTGAVSRQIGRFELAHGSTIFLDEIGELSYEVQAKLLRVLQEGQFERLGSGCSINVDVRVIAATNRDLTSELRQGRFREDLYYRLNVFPITIPPLRERLDDIPLLVAAFVREFEKTMKKTIDRISRRSMNTLKSYSWPGNVRELRNVIERAMILNQGSTLRIQAPQETDHLASAGDLSLEESERKHILNVLEKTNWRIKGQSGAAEILRLKPATLFSRLKKLGIHRSSR